MIMRSLGIGLLTVICLGAPAMGQNLEVLGSIDKEYSSVTKVIQRAGCDLGWLARVLIDSGIHPKNLAKLPVGQEIRLQTGLCKTAPPPATARVSQTLMREVPRSEIDPPARNVEPEKTREKQVVTKPEITVESAPEPVPAPVAALVEVPAPMAETVESSGLTPLTVALVAVIGLVAFVASRRGGISSFLPKAIRIKFHGVRHSFARHYKCPLCEENNLKEDVLREHLKKKHPELRITNEIVS